MTVPLRQIAFLQASLPSAASCFTSSIEFRRSDVDRLSPNRASGHWVRPVPQGKTAATLFIAVENESFVSAPTEFEPILPDASSFAAFSIIVLLCVAAAKIWAADVVPAKRTELAIAKSRGEVSEYLEELRKSSEIENYEDTEIPDDEKTRSRRRNRAFERWLFSDWLNSGKGSQKSAAIPILKKAKWNSGDNPVLVASGLIMLCVLLASVSERLGDQIF